MADNEEKVRSSSEDDFSARLAYRKAREKLKKEEGSQKGKQSVTFKGEEGTSGNIDTRKNKRNRCYSRDRARHSLPRRSRRDRVSTGAVPSLPPASAPHRPLIIPYFL